MERDEWTGVDEPVRIQTYDFDKYLTGELVELRISDLYASLL